MQPTAERTLCFLLTPERGPEESALRARPETAAWTILPQDDAHATMAELCLRDRARAARSAWGLRPVDHLALVVAEPEAWDDDAPDIEHLIGAVPRYLPSVTVLTWASGRLVSRAGPSLAASPAVEPTRPAPEPVSTAPRRTRAAAPALRLSGPMDPETKPASPAPPVATDPPSANGAKHAAAPPLEADVDDDLTNPDEEAIRVTRAEIDMLLEPERGGTPS